jgi:hypothetical protein
MMMMSSSTPRRWHLALQPFQQTHGNNGSESLGGTSASGHYQSILVHYDVDSDLVEHSVDAGKRCVVGETVD